MQSLIDNSNSISKGSQEVLGLSSLDKSYRNNCNSPDEKVKKKHYCGHYSFIGRFEDGSTKAIRHKCKTWGCGVCGPEKLKGVKMGIYREADRNKLNRFLTLTLPGDYKGDPDESIAAINKIWSKFRIYLKRKYKGSIHYIKIVEIQKRKVAHIHVLIDRFIPQRWISAAWSALGGGRIVDIRFVDLHRVSGYVSKYMTKEMTSSAFGNYRRYGTSQGIRIIEKPATSEGTWEFSKGTLDALFQHALGKMRSGDGLQMSKVRGLEEIDAFEVNFGFLTIKNLSESISI